MIDREKVSLDVDRLVKTITRKLEGNKGVLARSLGHGRLSWRMGKNGEFEVALELKL